VQSTITDAKKQSNLFIVYAFNKKKKKKKKNKNETLYVNFKNK